MMSYHLPAEMLGKRLNVLLIGCGGTGSFFAEEITQMDTAFRAIDPSFGFDVTMYDGSDVSQANLVRQRFFPTQIGLNKAIATTWKTNNLYGRDFKAVPRDFTPNTNYQKYDIIVTALDRPSTRYKLYQAMKNNHKETLWLDLGNDDSSLQVVLGELGLKSTLPTICDLYDYENASDADALKKSCSATESLERQDLGVNATTARFGAQILWNLVRHGSITTHGAHINIRNLEIIPINVDPNVWSLYGYVQDEIHNTETA